MIKTLFNAYIIGILLLLFSTSCVSNVKNITIQIYITDKYQHPVSDAEILVLCREDLGFFRDELSFDEQTILTDTNGYFKCTFKKGYEIDIVARAKGYTIKTMYIKNIHKNANITENIVLEIDTLQNHPAILYNNNEKISIIKSEDNKILTKVGINVSTGESVEDTTLANVWLRNNDLLVAEHGGGIIPIFCNKKGDNIYRDFIIAPLENYFSIYRIKGDENGYFIKTKNNKYAKFIISGAFNSVGAKNGKVYTENGFNVNVVFQTDKTNILNINDDIDLKQLLLREQ
ncbi:hypothetical protein FACS1894153_3570 [Bacteroidia bacterium]|nr:hypothetical protein FACS1894153_3570 [Bacteroidia bacterium]